MPNTAAGEDGGYEPAEGQDTGDGVDKKSEGK
jgi:hypothetical protein